MGMYSERLATTITAELLEWRLRENGGVEGIIFNSIDRDYRDGELFLFYNTVLTHFRHAEGFWSDHFLMKQQTGNYFLLKDKNKYVSEPMA